MTTGILQQIADTNTTYYATLTLDVIDEFLRDLQTRPPSKDITVPVGGFMSRYLTALHNNDEVELEKLNEEALIYKIRKYKGQSNTLQIDYDIIYMLSSIFSPRSAYEDVNVWEIETIYNNENEYDDSCEVKELVRRDGKWFIEEYHAEGYYGHDSMKSKEISDEDVFSLICNENKKDICGI